MKAISRGLDSFIEAMFGTLDKTGKVWARVGAIVLAVAAAMSFDFGHQVSFKHGLFLASLVIVLLAQSDHGPERLDVEARAFGLGIGVAQIGGECRLLLLEPFDSGDESAKLIFG